MLGGEAENDLLRVCTQDNTSPVTKAHAVALYPLFHGAARF